MTAAIKDPPSKPVETKALSAIEDMPTPGGRRTLNDKHRAELRASAISDDLIDESGIYSAADQEIRQVLRWQPRDFQWGEGFVIPFLMGQTVDSPYARVKLDFPRKREGKVVKYESPLNAPNRAYFPPRFFDLHAEKRLVVFTEGEKKALAATAAGFACIGLVGVWGWQERRKRTDQGRAYGLRLLIPDLAALDWKQFEVIIAFDSDIATKPQVQLAEARLAEVLTKFGSEVRVVRLPADGEAKVGLDDFLVAHGPEGPAEFRRLIEQAQPAEVPDKMEFMEWARLYMEEVHTLPSGTTLRWWRDQFWAWDGRCYRPVADSELTAVLLTWLDENQGPATPHAAKQILKCLNSCCRVPFDLDQPVYQGPDGFRHQHWLTTKNGILDMDARLAGHQAPLQPHTPQWFSPTALPYRYIPQAECPIWQKTLQDIFEEDEERIQRLGEWFGYCLTTDTSQHAILLLEGPPRSGKGTILRTLRMVVGEDNCVSPRLNSLGETFGLWSLMGKRVAICADAHLGHGDRMVSVLETIKLISGEDAVEVHRKHLPPVTTRLRIRFILAVNELPSFVDNSTALAMRLLILPLRKSFRGREDRDLEQKLAAEAEGIFNWALDGLARLRKNGRFTQPAISQGIQAEFERLSSPVKTFLDDCCTVSLTASVERGLLWQAWHGWCQANDQPVGRREQLGSRLRALIPHLHVTQPRQDDGSRPRHYVGVGLRDG